MMKPNVSHFLLVLIFVFTFIVFLTKKTSAQLFSNSPWLQNIEVVAYGGAGASLPVGSYFKEIRSAYKDWSALSDESYQFTGDFLPQAETTFGVRAAYPFWDKFRGGLGFQFARRGYQIKEVQKYQDPDFQYDEKTAVKRIVKYNVLEIPFLLSYYLKEEVEVFGGFSLSASIRKTTASSIYVFEKEVITNGEYSEENSIPREKTTTLLEPQIRKAHLSWVGGLRFPVWKMLDLQISGQYTGELFKAKQGVHILALRTGIAYQF